MEKRYVNCYNCGKILYKEEQIYNHGEAKVFATKYDYFHYDDIENKFYCDHCANGRKD